MENGRRLQESADDNESLCRALRRLRVLMLLPLMPLFGAGVADLVYVMDRGTVPPFLKTLTYYAALYSIPCFAVIFAGWMMCRIILFRRVHRQSKEGIENAVARMDSHDPDKEEQ